MQSSACEFRTGTSDPARRQESVWGSAVVATGLARTLEVVLDTGLAEEAPGPEEVHQQLRIHLQCTDILAALARRERAQSAVATCYSTLLGPCYC